MILRMMLWIVGGLILFTFAFSFFCFLVTFYQKKRKAPCPNAPIEIPPGKIYEPFRPQLEEWGRTVRAMPYESVQVRSYDGLTLCGRYYECKAGAPIELMFHGYRGDALRDLSGGVMRCFALEHNVLIVDQRAAGESEGRVITFGIKEHLDCITWAEFAVQKFGAHTKIILCGVSMGASTVLCAASHPLPPQVVGVLADCGYSDAKSIICHVVKKLHLPPKLVYPFIRLGARLYGGFDTEQTSAVQSMQQCLLPVLFIHGDTDAFVPYEMSEQNYQACVAKKKLVCITGAGHGLAYMQDPPAYLEALHTFFDPLLEQKIEREYL